MYTKANIVQDQYATPYRYFLNGLDVTYWVMNEITPPGGWYNRFFEIEAR